MSENKAIEKMNERARLLDKPKEELKTVYGGRVSKMANYTLPNYVTSVYYSIAPFGGAAAYQHLNCEPIDDAELP